MWYSIKQTVKDLPSLSVLRVQRVVNGEVKEYIVQEDVEQAIQRECKVRFSFAHSAPTMKTILSTGYDICPTSPWPDRLY